MRGSSKLMTQNCVVMIMFEFNPGLGEGEHLHGMWGKKGDSHCDLLDITTCRDTLGCNCYLDLTMEPRVRRWSNVVCVSRKWGTVAWEVTQLATMIE